MEQFSPELFSGGRPLCRGAGQFFNKFLERRAASSVDGVEVRVPDATTVLLRARHFLFNTDAKPNQTVRFETADNLTVDGSLVIPKGLLAVASIDESNDVKELGRGAKGQLVFKYLAIPDGTRLRLRGAVDLRGKTINKGALIGATVLFGAGAASITGQGFAIPAGALFSAEFDGEQKFLVSRTASSENQK